MKTITSNVRRAGAVAAVGLLGGAALCTEPADAARRPTYIEKVTIMDAFNVPGRSFASRCVTIRVSTVNPRYSILRPRRNPPRACVKAQEVGDGFVFFKRRTTRAHHWRDVLEGSGFCPKSIPRRVRVDLLPAWCS